MNILAILKDCPKGTKLYSPLCGHCTLSDLNNYLIEVLDTNANHYYFYYNGSVVITGECLLFPSKENRDWSTFQRPFNDGDIVTTDLGSIFIIKVPNMYNHCYDCHVALNDVNRLLFGVSNFCISDKCRFATEEEKQKLFDAIKENGYKWNAETKTLEKLIVPKFKVGNSIRCKYSEQIHEITIVKEASYCTDTNQVIWFKDQNNYELVSNKFDITTLKPFESRVLVRDKDNETWSGQLYSHYNKHSDKPFICIGVIKLSDYKQCIPYEGNEHLLGNTDDCDEYYKTW